MVTITKSQFKQLILLQVVLLLAAVSIPFIFEYPAEFQAIQQADYNAPFTLYEKIMMPFGFIFILWFIQNISALYTFKHYARKHLLILTGIGIFMSIIYYPLDVIFYFSIEDMFYYLEGVITGCVLVIVYCSNLAREFDLPAIPAPEVKS